MTRQRERTTVGELPTPEDGASSLPAALTRGAWLLWSLSVGVLIAHQLRGEPWELAGVFAVDGLTAVMWVTITLFSGVVHSYSRRYVAGARATDRFFRRVFGFTLVVMALVAAESFVAFGAAWLAMGVVMAGLIGSEGWPQAAAAAGIARRYFVGSTAALAVGLGVLWWSTGVARVSGVEAAVEAAPPAVVAVVAGALLLAAAIQSALLPFHGWLLSSMTAPTPASALMHAGFVNAGGILLARFAPVVVADPLIAAGVVLVGVTSALGGKLLKSVQVTTKARLGCSTVGQMGFMIAQAGLGFFGAAVTHLVLHGFYKAYLFLSSGETIDNAAPSEAPRPTATTPIGLIVTAVTGLAAAGVFAVLTGKATGGGLLLTGLVALTTMHAAWTVVRRSGVPATVRYLAVPVVALPAVALYATVYLAVSGTMSGVVTAPADLTVVHGVVGAAFLGAYVAVETGVYRRSDRLYVALMNAGRPAAETLLTATEEYDGR